MKTTFARLLFSAVALTFTIGHIQLAGLAQAADAETSKVIKFAVNNLKVYEDTTKVLAAEVEKLGYTLEYIFLADNTQINEAVESGDYFANYHQHTPYMEEFNRGHKGHLVAAFTVFTDKSGIFSKKYKSLGDLPEGARISLPVDVGNNFRTYVMLAQAGLIKTRPGVEGPAITQNDITENPKKLEFIEVDYTMLGRAMEEADAGFLYATVAAEIGLDISRDALVTEPVEYQAADIIAVREENLNDPRTGILKQAYYTDALKQALRDSYAGRDILDPAW
ncbi:MAG: ABC transporter substrate-binding protein [Deltaproteobacteria bacterium]|jgi:D-methionine transport system substrate-binding protein|nr:ABC transporter substrate-binding protein [Deltaproteobacteria bacterium]